MKEHAAGEASPYLDPLSDTGFMQLFANNREKGTLLNFLNALLKGDELIRDLEYKPDTRSKDQPRPGEILLDLACTDEVGEPISIHLQRSCQGIAYESLLYHCARLLARQPPPEKLREGFLARIYIVGLMNFTVPTCNGNGCIMDRRMKVRIGSPVTPWYYDVKLVVKAIEVPRFAMGEKELQTDLDKWLFLLKNIGGMKKIPCSLTNTPFEKVFQAVAS